FEAALREFLPLAQKGDAQAQFYLGFMYRNGQGTPEDFSEAVNWYRRAAEQGVAGAQFNLGLMYDNGQGVPQDYAEAVLWYRRAAEQGIAGAQFNLGLKYRDGEGLPPDLVQAHFWFNLATATARPNGALQYMAFNQRRILAQRLSSVQLKRAQELAKAWWAEHSR
ncbi:MAG: tetratricopeptide repeat protein, partial [Alphaproteobacteria bacterium]